MLEKRKISAVILFGTFFVISSLIGNGMAKTSKINQPYNMLWPLGSFTPSSSKIGNLSYDTTLPLSSLDYNYLNTEKIHSLKNISTKLLYQADIQPIGMMDMGSAFMDQYFMKPFTYMNMGSAFLGQYLTQPSGYMGMGSAFMSQFTGYLP